MSIAEQLLESAYEKLRSAEQSGDEEAIADAQKRIDDVRESLSGL